MHEVKGIIYLSKVYKFFSNSLIYFMHRKSKPWSLMIKVKNLGQYTNLHIALALIFVALALDPVGG